jgi:hypothetical protein
MVKVYDLERKSTFVKCKSSIRFTKCEEWIKISLNP